jgi:hypothetical protein
MTRPVLATGALVVIVAVLGAALLFGRGPSPNVGGPSATPSTLATAVPTLTANPTPTAAGGPVLSPLRARWMGGNHAMPGIDAAAGTSIIFDAGTFAMSQSNANPHPALIAAATSVGSQTVRLVSTVADANCGKGDSGLYDWSVTADGRTLTITAQKDACATRLAAVPGTWYLDGCKDSQTDCLGDVAAGTYKSQYIAPRVKATDAWGPVYGAVTYTVPDGWANSSDWPSTLGLTPSNVYDALAAGNDEGGQNILVVAQATPMSQLSACSGKADATVARTVDAEMTWLRHVHGLVTTAPTSITIDGHAGQWVDVRLDPTWKAACPGGPGPEVGYLLPEVTVASTAQRQRVFVLDLGSGDLVAIVVNSDTTAPFTAFAGQAMPIVESFTFK